MNLPERLVRWFDDEQEDRRWLSQPIGVIRKYADDRGSALAGLLSYQVFLGMLPLLVVALTVLARMVQDSGDVRDRILDSAIGQFPVVGDRLRDDVATVGVHGVWLVVTLLALLWTATGIYNAFQFAVNQVWNVGGAHRQGFFARQVRALALFVLVVGAAIGTSFLRDLGGAVTGATGELLSLLAAIVVASVLLLGVFRLVAAPVVPARNLLLAAAVAGTAWSILQRLGSWIVARRLAEAEDLYGAVGFVVVTLVWINLLARSVVLANEVAVVQHRRLWPRRIAQPPLSSADREVLAWLLNNERRRPEERITLRFDDESCIHLDGDGLTVDGLDSDRSLTSSG